MQIPADPFQLKWNERFMRERDLSHRHRSSLERILKRTPPRRGMNYVEDGRETLETLMAVNRLRFDTLDRSFDGWLDRRRRSRVNNRGNR